MILKHSDSDMGQYQESMVASSCPSRDAEGFTELPTNVKGLEPVIGMLMDKVAYRAILFAIADDVQDTPEGASAEWHSKAREMARSLWKHELSRKKKVDEILHHIDGEMSWVESKIWKKMKEDV